MKLVSLKKLLLRKAKIELNSKGKLLRELQRIHLFGWIDSKRLDAKKKYFTMCFFQLWWLYSEAELGITPNGYSEPDYLGWEVKQFSVKDFKKYNSAVVTLMTPEPTHGFYVDGD